MPRDDYREKLDGVREGVLYMGDVVLARLEKSLYALEQGDSRKANEVVGRDGEVNDVYLELEADCIDLLALQQPVAGDLRFVVASFKILTDLERIADLAVNFAEYAVAFDDSVDGFWIHELGKHSLEMLEDALEAYEKRDEEACYAVRDRDRELDTECEHAGQMILRDAVVAKHSAGSDAALQTTLNRFLVARDIERVGDHSVNIAARTLYMVENDTRLIK